MSSVAEPLVISFEGRPIALQTGQTVLAGLEAAGEAVETSCRSGVCQSCLMQAVEGAPPKRSQVGLSAAQVSQGLFMACVCMPEGPLAVTRSGRADARVQATVESLDRISDTVLRVRLMPLSDFPFRPGQFIRLITEDRLIRSYSIASTPSQGPLVELHVRLIPGGRMSSRLAHETALGDRLVMSGPSGGCYYDGIDPDRPLVLAGVGTGLAPLWGVLNDALARGHRGPIVVYHGALDPAGLYLRDELRALEKAHSTVRYCPCVRDGGDPATGDLISTVAADPTLKRAAVFLCGDAPLVERLRRTLFLAGARLSDIRADSFAAAA